MHLDSLPQEVRQLLPLLHTLDTEQKSVLIHYLQDDSPKKTRQLGTLAHIASVEFSDDWAIGDGELLGGDS